MSDQKKPDIRFLLDEILSEDEKRQQTARLVLLALDEDAVSPLVDTFYAGVSEVHGIVILDVVAEIGGPEAINLLEDVFQHPEKTSWRRWAMLGLARNNREDILDVVFDWLQNGEKEERRAATLALGYIGGDTAEAVLVHALDDQQISSQAVRALEKRMSIEGLAAGYQIADAYVWEMVTDALLNLGDEGMLPLVQILQTENPEFYDKVFVSLQNLNRPEAKEVLEAGDYNQDGSRKD